MLIFVFDVSSREAAPDMLSFASTIRALREFSPNSKVFALIHKMDLVPGEQRAKVFQQKTMDVRTTCEDEGFLQQQVEFWARPSGIRASTGRGRRSFTFWCPTRRLSKVCSTN